MTTTDINAGTIDNTIIGGNNPAAGTFTTLTANNQLVVNAGASIIGDTSFGNVEISGNFIVNDNNGNYAYLGKKCGSNGSFHGYQINANRIQAYRNTSGLDSDGNISLGGNFFNVTNAEIQSQGHTGTIGWDTTIGTGWNETQNDVYSSCYFRNIGQGSVVIFSKNTGGFDDTSNKGSIYIRSKNQIINKSNNNLILESVNGSVEVNSNMNANSVTTLASLVATTADINGGTIDNTVIGQDISADGFFTTLTATTIIGTLAGGAENSNKVKGTSTNGSITRVMGGTVLVDRLSNGTNEGFVDATGYTISREALANSEFLFKAVLHYRCAYEADQRIKFKIIRSKSSSFNLENVTIYEGPYLGPSNAAGPYNGIANIEVYDDFNGSGADNITYYYKIQYQLESANSEYETTSTSGILGGSTNRNLLMIQEFAN